MGCEEVGTGTGREREGKVCFGYAIRQIWDGLLALPSTCELWEGHWGARVRGLGFT